MGQEGLFEMRTVGGKLMQSDYSTAMAKEEDPLHKRTLTQKDSPLTFGKHPPPPTEAISDVLAAPIFLLH